MDLDKTLKGIQKKLGKENSAMISDDIANILAYNKEREDELVKRDETIKSLRDDKEMLITANGNLLKQVSQVEEEVISKKEEKEEYKPFNMRDALDEKGRFKR